MKLFSNWYLSTKILLINSFIFLIIGGVVAVVFLSFGNIEQLTTTIMNQDLPRVLSNANVGRELSRIFADVSHLMSVFLEEKERITSDGERLLQSLAQLTTERPASQLPQSLNSFGTHLETLLTQARKVEQTYQEVLLLDTRLEEDISTLHELTSKTAVLWMMEGKDGERIERLNLDIPWYREILLRVATLLNHLTGEYLRVKLEDSPSQTTLETITGLLRELDVRLQPLLDSDPEIEALARQIRDSVQLYQDEILQYDEHLSVFQSQLNALDQVQRQILMEMETIDKQVADTSSAIQGNIDRVLRSSKMYIIVLTGVILVALAIAWLSVHLMLRPLGQLSKVAEQLADGDIECDRDMLRHADSQDELGILARAFWRLILYIQEMAAAARKILQGELRLDMHPRSNRDVLGHAFHTMSAYLDDIASAATAIASGDLRREIHPKTDKDVLGNAFQRMDALRQSMREISDAAAQLRTASEALDTISAQMASTTEQTSQQAYTVSSNSQQISENVDAVAVSIEEMSSGIREISKNTVQVAEVANSAVEIASSATAAMNELEARSQEISDVISVITAITQQTNLLALNATIEAARAGDAGKGFAVVATEIKDLSRETAGSAEHIIQKLEAIRSSSSEVTAAIQKVSQIIGQIRDSSESTAGGVEEQSVTTNEIAQRMTNTAQGSQDITRVIADVATMSLHTSEGAGKLRQAARELADLAEHLKELVEKFKI